MRERPPFPTLTSALLLCVALLVLEWIMVAVFVDLREPLGLSSSQIGGMATLLAYGVLLSAALAHQGRSYRQLFHDTRHQQARVLAAVALPVLMLVPGLVLVEGWLQQLLLLAYTPSAWESSAFEQMSDGSMGAVLLGCVLAPVLEEMLFRGVILRGFLQRYPPQVAIVHSAAIFGLAHLNVYQFCGAMLIGLLLGWLYERTRSLWPCILLHAAYNSAVLWPTVSSAGTTPDPGFLDSPLGLAVAAGLAGWGLQILWRRLG